MGFVLCGIGAKKLSVGQIGQMDLSMFFQMVNQPHILVIHLLLWSGLLCNLVYHYFGDQIILKIFIECLLYKSIIFSMGGTKSKMTQTLKDPVGKGNIYTNNYSVRQFAIVSWAL